MKGAASRGFGPDGAWIDFHGTPGTLTQHSFSAVEEGRVPDGAFRGKIVVVGAVAPSLQDVAATSASGDELMSGPEIQAESISTILRGFPLRETSRGLGWLLTLGLGAFPVLAGLFVPPLRGLLAAAGVAVLFAVAAYAAFAAGWIVPVVAPLAALGAGAVGVLAVLVVQEALERRRLRDIFARFVPEQVVDEVLRRTDEDLRLGGVRRECTVLFSDLRGFTTYSEGRPPDEVIQVLNEYLTEMSDAILDCGGTLVSYMGDGIMAVFGAPLDQPDHRDRSLAAAREMLAPSGAPQRPHGPGRRVPDGHRHQHRPRDVRQRLGPGDFFGELALLEEDRRTATVTATSPMTVIVMSRASFRAIDRSMPGVHAAVQEAIEQRLSPSPGPGRHAPAGPRPGRRGGRASPAAAA